MNRKKQEPFEVCSYVGTSLGDFSADGERPSRTAKLVADVSWAWSPMHSARIRYLICTDRKRTGWMLWAVARDFDGRRIQAQVAVGGPCRGYTAKFAAGQLLTAGWRSELEMWGTDSRGAKVEEEGLLTKDDIRRIESEVFHSLDD